MGWNVQMLTDGISPGKYCWASRRLTITLYDRSTRSSLVKDLPFTSGIPRALK